MATRRRGNGEGTIRQKPDGRWEARYRDGSGVRRSIMGKTRSAVAGELAAAIRDRDKGLPTVIGARQTVEEYLRAWLETMRPPRVRESTWLRNETFIRLQIIPTIGKVRLTQLNRMHLQQLYAKCLAAGLSSTTVNHMHGVLHHALKDAMRSDLIPRNVAELASPPRVKKREMQVYTTEQVDQLLTVAEGHRLAPIITLTVATGMRVGELLALHWSHIDVARGVLHVRRTRTRTATGFTDGNPKTESSMRDIRLIPSAIDALRAHRVQQAKERLELGNQWADEDRVFPSSIGTAMDPANLRKHWLRLLTKAGLPEIHFHDLRHSAASWLLAQGVPVIDVSKMLGHADASITLRIYGHAMPDSQDRVVAAMEFLLPRRQQPASEPTEEAAQDA